MRLGTIFKAGAVVLLLGLVGWLFVEYDLQSRLKELLEWVGGKGLAGIGIFVLAYMGATVLFIPGSILTLGAGFVFGVVEGVLYVSVASTLGATIAFLLGRYVARDWVARKIEGYPRFATIDRAVAREGWKIVGLTRLSPIFPFNLLNYAYGLTGVPLGGYFLASWIGMLPGTAMYVYLGSLAGSLATIGAREGRTAGEWILYAVGLLATVAVTIHVTKIARQALSSKLAEEEGATENG